MKRNDYYTRLAVKAVLFYFVLAFTVFSVSGLVLAVSDVLESENDKTLSARLERVRYNADRNDYVWLIDCLEFDMDYEEEFEYMWERAIMHECSVRYRLYLAAEEKNLGGEFTALSEKYKQEAVKYCQNPKYPQNEPYGEYFMELAEK